MTYVPTESLNVTWAARNDAWRNINPARREDVTNVPRHFRGLLLRDLPHDETGAVVRRWCRRWVRGGFRPLDDDDLRGKGLLITGKPGLGKTRVACIAAQHVSDVGVSTKFVQAKDYYDLALQVFSAKDPDRREQLEGAFECFEAGWSGWRLVVLDDLGKEYKTTSGFSENKMDGLIRSRYYDGAPTIVTSNLTLDEITESYGPSMGSFVHEAFWLVPMKGKDRRGN